MENEKRLTWKRSLDGFEDVGLCDGVTVGEAICKLADLEERDAVEVVHGRWVFGELDILGQPVHCSVCGWGQDKVNKAIWLEYPAHKYCGHCGAKMDGGNEE